MDKDARVFCCAGIGTHNRFGVLEDAADEFGQHHDAPEVDHQITSEGCPGPGGPFVSQQPCETPDLMINDSTTGWLLAAHPCHDWLFGQLCV